MQICSCVNLKEVNDYSSRSVKSIQKFEELDYSFLKACNHKCLLSQLEQQKISKTTCSCSIEKSADSVTTVIYKAVNGYFTGLANLSDNKLTDYSFLNLSKALHQGDFGDLKISKKETDAYAKIATLLSKVITDSYRKKKISLYIGEANGAIDQLLESLMFILSANLAKRLETQKERIKSYYFDLSTDASTSVYEKKKIIEEYSSELAGLETKRKQIESFTRGLQTISKGHHKLFENRNTLKSGELKILLIKYAGDIEVIINEFNKIKNVN